MLLLKQCAPEPLDLYGEHIRSLHEAYGSETWFLIYQADVRMRSEEFERIRRRLRADAMITGVLNPSILDEKRPWESVFLRCVHPGDVESSSFWTREVREKVMWYLTRIRGSRELTSQHTIQDPALGQGS
eukprot:14964976-Alexandrium_andersonii.AAC.1